MSSYIFIRHARPDIPLGERRCIGSTDLPLGALGRMQACLLGECVHFKTVYSSPQRRAVETASFITDEVIVVPGLEETDCGQWDGLSFDEIKQRWPELYARRGEDLSLPMPGAESPEAALSRFRSALAGIPEGSPVVTHNSVLHAYLGIPDEIKLPYACIIRGASVECPRPKMTPAIARRLRNAAGLLTKIQRHCDAVTEEALLLASGLGLDEELIECAALLHDIARLEKDHEHVGASYMEYLGYPELAWIIRQHGTLEAPEVVDEAAVVFLADKYRSDTERVGIDERYDRTLIKCKTPEAVARHERSRTMAKEVEKRFIELKDSAG